jgi:single-stranded DNA-binding protein
MAAAGDVNKMILVANLGKDPEVGERKTAPNFIGLE